MDIDSGDLKQDMDIVYSYSVKFMVTIPSLIELYWI
jgi:hypothetical protein